MFPELKLISVTKKLPAIDQNVIVWNGNRLVAAKYHKDNYSEGFQIEKYATNGERSFIQYWLDVTHWMPAEIESL